MKKVQYLFVALLATLFFTTTAIANTSNVSPESSLRAEIVDLIEAPSADILLGEECCVADMRLMVNRDNELIVVDTGTKNAQLDKYLKSKLNYKKVTTSDIQYFNFYFIKVEFRS